MTMIMMTTLTTNPHLLLSDSKKYFCNPVRKYQVKISLTVRVLGHPAQELWQVCHGMKHATEHVTVY